MKRFLMAVIATFASMAAFADGEVGLYIIAGETSTYPVSELQKISFQDNNVVVLKSDGSKETIAIANISKMYFGEVVTGINELQPDAELWDGNSLKADADQAITVYNSSGMTVSRGKYSKGDVIHLDNMPRGIYIVEMGNKSFKIAK